MPKVAVIIVNYCTAQLVVECLASIANDGLGSSMSVYIVDNNSPDKSADAIAHAVAESAWHPWCTLIRLESNKGFSAGNNAGLRCALERDPLLDYVLLLNPDTFIRPGAVQALGDFMVRHPQVGIVGSRLEDVDGMPQRSAFRFPCVLGELENGMRFGPASKLLNRFVGAMPPMESAHCADWVSGASMMIRREVFAQIGMFDEDYFLYFEEVDFCRRARRAGWSCWYVPESRVVHLGGQSTSTVNKDSGHQPMYDHWLASRHRYFRKHHSRLAHGTADLFWAGGFATWRLRRLWQNKPDTDPPGLLRDFVRCSLGMKSPLRTG